jgi:hypothetical protein
VTAMRAECSNDIRHIDGVCRGKVCIRHNSRWKTWAKNERNKNYFKPNNSARCRRHDVFRFLKRRYSNRSVIKTVERSRQSVYEYNCTRHLLHSLLPSLDREGEKSSVLFSMIAV